MEKQNEIEEIYNKWEKTLPPQQRIWCQKALKNINLKVRNMGEKSSKELLVMLLLFYQERHKH